MNRDVVLQGLLKIGSLAGTRTDAGKKAVLTDAAGGFGLAKVLIFLCQGGFRIWTKMAGDGGCYIEAKFGREDPERCKIQSFAVSPSTKQPPGKESNL